MRLTRVLVAVTSVCVLLAAVAGARYQNDRVPIDEVYTPMFRGVIPSAPLEALKGLDRQLQEPRAILTIEYFLPGQPGNLWISLLVLLVVGVNFARPGNGRNTDLVIAQMVGWSMMGSINLLIRAGRLNDPAAYGLIRLIFEFIVVVTLVLFVRLILRFRSPDPAPWTVAVGTPVLAAVATYTLILATTMPFLHRPDDSTYFTELGGQRLRERGLLPYGDPMLTRTPGAAYAPLMYAAQAGIQFLLAEPVNSESPDLPVLGENSKYIAPAPFPGQVLLAAFQAMAAWALFVVGRRWSGDALGFALVALYCGSSYVLGVGGSDDLVSGMTFVSHILPPAVTLVAFAFLDRPPIAGALLAAAAAFGFYPAFMFPAWLGYQWGVSSKSALRFVMGFGAVSLAIGAWVLLDSRPADGLSLIATVLRDTLGHHTDPAGYGRSPFGLWGQQAGILRWVLQPLMGTSALTSPFFVVFCGYLAVTAAMARRAGPVGLALLTATVAMGANIWKIHATATYVTWYYPFVLLGTLGPGLLVRRAVHSINEPTVTT